MISKFVMRHWLEYMESLNKNEESKEFPAQMTPKMTLLISKLYASSYQHSTEAKKIIQQVHHKGQLDFSKF